jgi:hypothetical protein
MAKKEQLNILKRGVEDWIKWRTDNPGVMIDLREVDLMGVDLTHANLAGANLSGANLERADLTATNLGGAALWRANLTGANLTGANLRAASFGGADLTGASLAIANLSGANLGRADFTDVDLTSADLTDADLREANLTGVNLAGTHLLGADLTRANLTGADLTGSKIGYTIFGDTDLGSSVGLEEVRHVGPSTIGTDTIRKSQGKLPVQFLRGCGLSDAEIESAKLAVPGLDPEQVTQITYEIHRLYCDQPIQFYSCFISYSSKDHNFAQRVYDDLQDSGVRCWFAPEDLKIGDEFRRTIGKEIRLRDKLLIILSENSIQSEWVGDEVEKALAEEKGQGMLKLFPIRLDNAIFEAKEDWAEKIRLRCHIRDFSGDYARAFEQLLRDLKPS